MPNDIDEILIQFKDGDINAFEYLYDRFHSFVFLCAVKATGSEDDAKDIRSKCFLKLWELHDQLTFKSFGALAGWLKNVTLNASIDCARAVVIRKKKHEDAMHIFDRVYEYDPYRIVDKEAIVIDRILKKIDQLKNHIKQVFVLRHYGDLKFKEIAEILNLELSTVKKRYARALELIKEEFK